MKKVYRVEVYYYPDTRWLYVSAITFGDALAKARDIMVHGDIVEVRELGDLHE